MTDTRRRELERGGDLESEARVLVEAIRRRADPALADALYRDVVPWLLGYRDVLAELRPPEARPCESPGPERGGALAP